MKTDVLFWASLSISCLSFFLFAGLTVAQTLRAKSPGGMGNTTPQSGDPTAAVQKLADAARSFAKAGPISTSAVLCALFAFIAFATSGIVKIG